MQGKSNVNFGLLGTALLTSNQVTLSRVEAGLGLLADARLLYGTMGGPHYCTLMSIMQASATVRERQRWLQLPKTCTPHAELLMYITQLALGSTIARAPNAPKFHDLMASGSMDHHWSAMTLSRIQVKQINDKTRQKHTK